MHTQMISNAHTYNAYALSAYACACGFADYTSGRQRGGGGGGQAAARAPGSWGFADPRSGRQPWAGDGGPAVPGGRADLLSILKFYQQGI